MKAIEFGKRHDSCEDAMEQRIALGPNATQEDWWLVCPHGDWLIWQLEKGDLLQKYKKEVDQLLEKFVARAIRRAQKSLIGNKTPAAKRWRKWARCWLSGEDRSILGANDACYAANATRYAAAAANAASYAAANVASYTADRTACYAAADGARYAAAATVHAIAAIPNVKEQGRQAREIRKLIPAWPGEVG